MKTRVQSGYIFSPGASGAGYLTLPNGFNPIGVEGVYNVSRSQFVYLLGELGFGRQNLVGQRIYFAADTSTMTANDDLVIVYENGVAGASEGTLQAVVALLTASLTVDGTVNIGNLPATQPVSAAALPLPSGAAKDGTDATGVAVPAGASGIRGWLSGVYAQALQQVASLSNLYTSIGAPSDAASASNVTGTVLARIARALNNWDTLLGRIPALVGGRIPVSVSGSVDIGNGAYYFTEARSQPVAANASFLGGWRSAGGPPTPFTKFAATLFSTQPGTLYIEGADDPNGSGATVLAAIGVAANNPMILQVPVTWSFHRVRFAQGTGAGSIAANSAYTAA